MIVMVFLLVTGRRRLRPPTNIDVIVGDAPLGVPSSDQLGSVPFWSPLFFSINYSCYIMYILHGCNKLYNYSQFRLYFQIYINKKKKVDARS